MNLQLRPITKEDCLLLFNWANDPDVRKNAIKADPIEIECHIQWFQKKLNTQDSHIFILEKEDYPIGQIRFDKEEDYWLIDFLIRKEYRGMGMGKIIVELGVKNFNGKIKAWVKKENMASCKVFENLGFRKESSDDQTFEYSLSK